MLRLNEDDKKFYKILVSLCIPIIVQNLISTSVNIIDTVMISSLGEASVASIGVANQFFFLFNMTMSGLTGGAGLFISQFFGRNDTKNIKKITSLSVFLGILLGLLFLIPAVFFPKLIIHFFSYDPEVIKLCTDYFSIIAFCYPLIAVSMIFSMGSRSIRNPNLGMICSGIALVTNVILNYCLIFGHLGFHAMGVKGAALATVIARIVEFVLLVGYIYFIKKDYLFGGYQHGYREYISDELKKELHLTDEEYQKLYPTIVNKSIPVLEKENPKVGQAFKNIIELIMEVLL